MLFGKEINLRGNIGLFSFFGFRVNSPCPAEDEARLEGNLNPVGIAVFLGFTGRHRKNIDNKNPLPL
jgi:hypothetical protein